MNGFKNDKLKVLVSFEFTVNGDPEKVFESINNQIINDQNTYWQNTDNAVQMRKIQIKDVK